MGFGDIFGFSSGAPDAVPEELTMKFALRKAMRSSLRLAQELGSRSGVEDVSGGSAYSRPLFTNPVDITQKIKQRTLQDMKAARNV